ncbi:dipeptidase PepE [Occultella gossypii]|uniref:Dipeptidase PepE n=1 Tax=Occultella gossypii TaxID=2800820 RepID=A0ABS7SFN5_9MICO|nr:dipeptidase PepE [Occultella gossypii]MBZ2199158.1 dipeptidase PepE [Occultella gossypii]
MSGPDTHREATMELLLLSNSTAPGRGYLKHARDAIAEAFTGVSRIGFVPFALADHDAYTAQVRRGLSFLDAEVVGLHERPGDPLAGLDAVFVGGGNSFRLVDQLQRRRLVEAIRDAVTGGLRYLGSSAGTNVATPSIRTTNDMPIVEPASFAGIGLVPFQINPHYLDPDPNSSHQGETRDERLQQYLEENDVPVLAMREGTWLRRSGAALTLGGEATGARLYRRGEPTAEVTTGTDLSDLLG